jgi:hypothetical protein
MDPIYTFTSHIAGKNARVSIYNDRIEWERPRGISGGKIAAGIMTAGLSLAATGVKNGKAGSEMIPVKNISSVTTKRDGLLNTLVSIITSGNTIDFRVSHAEAVAVKTVVTDLILGKYDAAAPAAAPATPAAAPLTPIAPQPDVAEQLQKLASLRDSGILTDEEFTAKKTELLARL